MIAPNTQTLSCTVHVMKGAPGTHFSAEIDIFHNYYLDLAHDAQGLK